MQKEDCRRQISGNKSFFRRFLNLRSAIPNLQSNELDWIVMRALDKDRSRRYESASAFAAEDGTRLGGKVRRVRESSCRGHRWMRDADAEDRDD